MAQNSKKYQEEKTAAVAPVYKGSYEDELKKARKDLAARPSFSYSAEEDPLYRQYKNEYVRQGRMAMKDSVGQASALTGGYASSYAQSLGRQQYDEYLTGLGELMPELYELAYSKYREEGDRLVEDYNRLSGLRDQEYGRYRDELEQFEENERLAYQREQDSKAYEEKQAEQSYSRKLSEAATLAKYGDFSGYAGIYGQETAENMKKSWIAANPATAFNMGLLDAAAYFAMTGSYAPGHAPAARSTSGQSSRYYPGTAPDGRDAALVQSELRRMGYNIAVDGAWGPKSQAAWEKAYGSTAVPGLSHDSSGLYRL